MKYDYQKEIIMNWINRIIRRPLNVKKIHPKVWILFVGTFLTIMCAVHLWKAYSQQKQNWNEQAKTAFFHAIDLEVEQITLPLHYTPIPVQRQISVKSSIPDSIKLITDNGVQVFHLPAYKRKHAYVNDGTKNALLSLSLKEQPLLPEPLQATWDSLLVAHDIKADTRVFCRTTDMSGHINAVCSETEGMTQKADSLVSTYLGYRLELEISGYISYNWWSLVSSGQNILCILLVCIVWFSLLYRKLFHFLLPDANETKNNERTTRKRIVCKPQVRGRNDRLYNLGMEIYFDAEQNVLCNENDKTIVTLSATMSNLLECFLKSPHHTLSKHDIYLAIGKELETYSLDSFYKMIGRLRDKLESVSPATISNDRNGFYQLVLPSSINKTEKNESFG